MREIKYYVAWDGYEFENESECLAYEERAKKCAQEFDTAYSFYNKDMNKIFAPNESADVEEWIDWLIYATERCEYVRRYANLTQEAEKFFYDEWDSGFSSDEFDNEIGLFRYNFVKHIWVKVGE